MPHDAADESRAHDVARGMTEHHACGLICARVDAGAGHELAEQLPGAVVPERLSRRTGAAPGSERGLREC